MRNSLYGNFLVMIFFLKNKSNFQTVLTLGRAEEF